MRLYIDLDTRGFVESQSFPRAITAIALKRGDNVPIDLSFVRGGVIQELDEGATGKIGIKPRGQFGSPFYLALDAEWEKSGSGDTAKYSLSLNLNTSEIESAFLAEPASVLAMLEAEWIESGLRTSSATLDVEIQNDVNRGNEGVPIDGTPAYPDATDLLTKSGNLADLTDPAVARTNLELGTIYDATNAQRLAGSNGTRTFVSGDRVRVTDQADRIEQFLGGTVGDNASWLVLENSFQVFIYQASGSSYTFTISGQPGVVVPSGVLTSIGWAKTGTLVTSNMAGGSSGMIYSASVRDGNGMIIIGTDGSASGLPYYWGGSTNNFTSFYLAPLSMPPRGQLRLSSYYAVP